MKKSQELQIKISEKRTRLAELLDKADKTDEEVNELDALTKEIRTTETEFRAALTAENKALDDIKGEFDLNDGGENKEIRELRGKVSVIDYSKAAVQGLAAAGAALEFNQALGMGAHEFPLTLLAGGPEVRQTTDTDTATTPRPWLDRLLAESLADYLGISFTSVDPGIASYPVTTAGATGAQRGKGEDADPAAWTVGVKELKPTRNTVHLEYSSEDAMRVPMLAEALTRDLRMGLMESVDRAVFVGDDGADGTDADITGLTTAADVVEKTLTQAQKDQPGETLGVFNELIDGIHAGQISDLRIVSSEGSHRLWTGTVLSLASETASVFKTLAQFLNDNQINWRVRNLEAATTNNKFGAFISRARGLAGAGVAPVWSAAELTRDPYTKAKSGEVLLTLSYYWNFGLPRPANFARLKFVT